MIHVPAYHNHKRECELLVLYLTQHGFEPIVEVGFVNSMLRPFVINSRKVWSAIDYLRAHGYSFFTPYELERIRKEEKP